MLPRVECAGISFLEEISIVNLRDKSCPEIVGQDHNFKTDI